jgi:hypothetical protein
LTTYRLSALITVFDGFNGPGGYGLDYRGLPETRGKVSRFYSGATQGSWFRIIRGAVHGVLAPGQDGPAPTARYEMLREGFKEAHALIYVDDNAANPKLPSDLTTRAKGVRARLKNQMSTVINRTDVGWAAETDNLYRVAAEMQTALGLAP